MYYSKHHKDLVFIDRGMGSLEFSGKGVISAGDTEVWNPDGNWKEPFTSLTVCGGITEIGEGVLEQFPNLRKLCLPESLTRIAVTDRLTALLRANDVLVRARFGSCGDALASENNLRFLPENIELGWSRNEEYDESDRLILQFHEDGSIDLLYDICTTGISAGSNGGASLERPMPEEYYPGCSLQEFAGMFPQRYYDQILRNPAVKRFLEWETERN